MMTTSRLRCVASIWGLSWLLLLGPETGLLAAQEPALQARDLLELPEFAEVAISPDGRQVVYTLRKRDLSANRTIRSHWRVSTTGGSPAPIDIPEEATRLGWWSDGTTLSYLAPAQGTVQLWLLPEGGLPRTVTDHDGGILSYQWTADGRRLAFTAETRGTATHSQSGAGVVVDKTYFNVYQILTKSINEERERRNGLWVRDMQTGEQECVSGNFHVTAYSWAPDGQTLAFTAQRSALPADAGADLLLHSVADRRTWVLESGAHLADWDHAVAHEAPFWSPDGTSLGYFRRDQRDRWSAISRLGVYSLEQGRTIFLMGESAFETYGQRPFWLNPDTILLENTHRAGRRLFSIALSTGEVNPIIESDDWFDRHSFSRDGRTVAYTKERIDEPVELFVSDSGFRRPKRLTDLHAGFSRALYPSAQRLRWQGEDGVEVEGWLYLPGGEGPFPTLLYVQGGPTAVVANRFAPTGWAWPHAFAVYASRGIAVLLPNYRGKGSFGKDFREPTAQDAEPVADILAGLGAIIARGIADPSRLAIAGHSHGGWLAPLVAVRHRRFVAGSFAEGWGNHTSLYGQMPGWLNRNVHEHYWGGTPYQDPDRYRELSPIYHFEGLHTASLFEFGEMAAAVQGLEFATAAWRAGTPHELVIYRDTGHNITEPRVMLEASERNLDWFEFWLFGRQDTVATKRAQYERWDELRNSLQGATDSLRGLLSKRDRETLALARARDAERTMVLIAAAVGAAGEVAGLIHSMGGEVMREEHDIDYVRALVPLPHVQDLADDPRIVAMDLASPSDAGIVYDTDVDAIRAPTDTRYTREHRGPTDPPPPGPHTPIDNPYMPIRDMQATHFRAEHPTFDGRGVTIAVLDNLPDILAPELATALSLDGQEVPKIVDLLTASDSRAGDDPMWVDMANSVEAVGGAFRYEEQTYRVPYDGVFRFGLFDERSVRGSIRGDVNRDGNPPGSSGLFGVLWDDSTDRVWVDTRQDLDFANERPLQPYAVRQDVGIFGVDDPETPERETVGFGIQIDTGRNHVALLIGADGHGSGAVGVAGGNRFFGGEVSAAAPNVGLVPIAAMGGGLAYLLEGLLLAARHPAVDLITSQIGTSGLGVGDGRDALTVLATRIIDHYGKPFFTSAGNQGTVARLAGSDKVVSVGGYQHRESWYYNYGTRVPNDHNILYASSYGPGGRGRLKPDFLAPSGVLSLYPRMLGSGPQRSAYPLPTGYQVFAGTSTASPMAASAAALLLSAAKQSGVTYDPGRIRDALRSTAWFVPGLEAYRQGAGLVRVPAAWERLQSTASGALEVIEVRGPMRTALSGLLDPAHEGFGIHEEEGWRPGMWGQRTLRMVRTSGPPEPLTYALHWSGDTLAFSSADSVTLPLHDTVAVPVEILAGAAGVQSAILTLHRAGVPGSVHQLMNVVVVSEPFSDASDFQLEIDSTIDRPGQRLVNLPIEPGTASLRFDLETEGVERALGTYSPTGVFGWPLHTTANDHWLRAYSLPEPGAWELIVRDVWRDSYGPDTAQSGVVPPTPFRLRASIREVVLEVARQHPLTVRATNRLAPFTGGLGGGPLAGTRRVSGKIATGEQHVYDLNVPEGSTLLHARLSVATGPAADLDMYVYDCTGERCGLAARSAGLGAVESVWIRDPEPGLWRVIVDAHAVADAVSYDYLDLFTDPRLGTVEVEDSLRPRPSGATWTAHVVSCPSENGATGRDTEILVLVREQEPDSELIQFDPEEGTRRLLHVLGFMLIPLSDLSLTDDGLGVGK
jgi:dipeptidyl aminopeptidase/acylaminoacyl peptidase